MFKAFGIIFLLHLIFLIAYIGLHPTGDITTDRIVLTYYLWPLFILPLAGGHAGGELFFSPIAMILNSLLLASIFILFKKRRLAR